MDRSSTFRIIGIAIVVFIAWKFIGPALGFGAKAETGQNVPPETYVDAPGFAPDIVDPPVPGQQAPSAPPEGKLCNIKGDRFDAVLSTRGAAITHFYLRDPQYAGKEGMDLSTTDLERWRSLRTLFRGERGMDQVKHDRFDWKLDTADGIACRFSYADDLVRIDKRVAANGRPFELEVTTTLANLDTAPHHHRFSIEAFAYRQNKEIKSHLGRVSPFITELSCGRTDRTAAHQGAVSVAGVRRLLGMSNDLVDRKSKDDFKEGWFSVPLVDRYVAVSNYYFAQAIVPVAAPEAATPICDILAEDWFTYGQKRDDDEAGAVYHGRLEYPPSTSSRIRRRPTSRPSSSVRRSVTSWRRLRDRRLTSVTSSTWGSSHPSPRCWSASWSSSTRT